MEKIRLFVLFAIIIFAFKANAQSPPQETNIVFLDTIDCGKYREKNRSCNSCAKTIGVFKQLNLDFFKEATKETKDEYSIYRLMIKQEGNPFIKFVLGINDTTFSGHFNVYNDLGRLVKILTVNDLIKGQLTPGRLKAKGVVIEYVVKSNSAIKPITLLKSAYYFGQSFDFKNAGSRGDALTCQNNVHCTVPNDGPWCNEIRSVLEIDYAVEGEEETIEECSGVLVNQNRDPIVPIVLTAAHCFNASNIDLSSCEFIFNWQANNCSGSDGNDNCKVIGAVASWGQKPSNENWVCDESDLRVVVMSRLPHWQYNVFYAGWDRGIANNTVEDEPNDGTVIHHPRLDQKKITQGNIRDGSHYGANACVNRFVNTWGTIEGGSSGSPLFYKNHRVIAIASASGGVTNCNSQNHKFAKIAPNWGWVDNILSPNNLSATHYDGMDYLADNSTCRHDDIEVDGIHYAAKHWQSQNMITIQARNSIKTLDGSTISGATTIIDKGAHFEYRATTNGNNGLSGGIILKPGFATQFTAEVNLTNTPITPEYPSSFRAYIGDCESFSGCGFNFATKIANPSGGVTDIENKTEDKFNPSVFETVSLGNGLPVYPTVPMVYPNPFFDALQVVFEVGTEQNIHISLMDVYSKSLYEKVYQNYSGNLKEQIPTAHLSKGCYLLRISYGDKQTVVKVIKE